MLKITNKPVILCYHRIIKQKLDLQIIFIKNLAPVKQFKTVVVESIYANPQFGIALIMNDCYYEDFINDTQILEKLTL
jgi:hypothetical protein